MQGWVSIHRQIKDHWLWEDKPFSYGQAWIDMLLMANHKEAKIPLGNEVITVDRGSFITSEIKLMDKWGWSKTKVRRFLDLLENDSMLIKKTDRKKTTLTICNYSCYQVSETDKEPIKNQKKTDKEPIKDTNNNVNNEFNENNQKDALAESVQIVLEYHSKLKNLPQANKITDARRSSIKARIKDYGHEEVLKVLDKANASDFLKESKKTNWYNFDWIYNPNNFVKIFEGNYENKNRKTQKQSNGIAPLEVEITAEYYDPFAR